MTSWFVFVSTLLFLWASCWDLSWVAKVTKCTDSPWMLSAHYSKYAVCSGCWTKGRKAHVSIYQSHQILKYSISCLVYINKSDHNSVSDCETMSQISQNIEVRDQNSRILLRTWLFLIRLLLYQTQAVISTLVTPTVSCRSSFTSPKGFREKHLRQSWRVYETQMRIINSVEFRKHLRSIFFLGD